MAVQTDTTMPPVTRKPRTVTHVVTAVVFTVVEAWALVVILAHVHAGGMDRIALAVALAGCVVAIIDVWQNVRAQRPTAAEPIASDES